MRRAIFPWLLCALACTHKAPSDEVTGVAPHKHGIASVAPGDLSAYPWARLRVPGKELSPLDAPLDEELERLGVQSMRAFMAQAPSVMLVVYEFADQDALLAAKDEILARRPPPRALQVTLPPPFYPEAAWTGQWLLIAGLPAEKPPSPEMEHARQEFVEAWWGQE